MNQSVLSLCVCGAMILVLATSRQAEAENELSTADSTSILREGQATDAIIELGPQLYYFDYNGQGGAPGFKSQDRGLLPGVSLNGVLSRRNYPWFLGGEAGFTTGIASNSSSGSNLLNLQIVGGYSFFLSDALTLSVYTGASFRRWQRSFAQDSSAPIGPSEEVYSTASAPIGIKWLLTMNDRFQLALDSSISIPGSSTLQVVFPARVTGTASDVKLSNYLSTNVAWKIQAPMTYWFNKNIGMTVNPFIESLSYNSSYVGRLNDVSGNNTLINEPSSQTYQYGSQVKLAVEI